MGGNIVARYGYSGPGDSPAFVNHGLLLVAQERTFGLLGGVVYAKGGANGDRWSYPNVHGDVMALADASGLKVGLTSTYDPFGKSLTALSDNEPGNFDYGWLGSHQRPLEHEGSLATIEMGARPYVPSLGRFLEVDPVQGGSANDYDYCAGDPVNCNDLDGRYAYHYTFDVGPAGAPGSAELMYRIQQSPQLAFPFVITGGSITEGQRLCTRPVLVKCDPVRVIEVTPTSFTFRTLGGHVEGAGAIITFSVAEENGRMLFRVDGRGPDGFWGNIPEFNRGRRAAAYSLWSEMAGNVRVVWGALGS